MTWLLTEVPREQITGMMVHDILKKHSLLPDNIAGHLDRLKEVGHFSNVFIITEGEDESEVATVIISNVVMGEDADLDFIPNPACFKDKDEYKDKLGEVMRPLLRQIVDKGSLRRVTAMVPYTRSRTKVALRTLGFGREGKMRDKVQFQKRPPEDLIIMGLLAKNMNMERV